MRVHLFLFFLLCVKLELSVAHSLFFGRKPGILIYLEPKSIHIILLHYWKVILTRTLLSFKSIGRTISLFGTNTKLQFRVASYSAYLLH